MPPKNTNAQVVNRRQNEPALAQNNNNQGGRPIWQLILMGSFVYLAIQIILPIFMSPDKQQLSEYVANNSEMVTNCLTSGDVVNITYAIVYNKSVLNNGSVLMIYTSDETPFDLNLDISLSDTNLTHNLTIEVQVTAVQCAIVPSGSVVFHVFENFTKYKRTPKLNADTMDDPTIGLKGSKYETKIPDTFTIMLIYSQIYYMNEQQFLKTPQTVPAKLKKVNGRKCYLFALDLSQLHITNKHYHTPKENQNVTISTYTYSFFKHSFLSGFARPPALANNQLFPSAITQIYNDDTINEMKEIMFQNNVILIAVTFILSALQTVFQFLAVKNDIKIWKNISQYKGLSLKALYTNLGISIIYLLYLIDNQSNKLVMFFEVVNIIVTLWKIFKTTTFIFKRSFPYFSMSYPSWYSSDVATHDSQSIKYFYYFLIPLFVCYCGYKVYTSAYTSFFSFILECLVGFIFIFGFVQMTPQIYINYKLKSVAHLPWRSLIYKFLNTIIDDLFAFMVTMPWLRRLNCFKDDVIFLIYLYQKMIYRTDYNRIGRVDYESEETIAPDAEKSKEQ